MKNLLEGPEKQRLLFLLGRDGRLGALKFAVQTRAIYRTAVLHSVQCRDRDTRKKFIESYLHFKRFINNV